MLILQKVLLKLITYYHTEDIPDNLPGEDVFYSKEMFYYFEHTPDYWPILLTAYDDQKVIGKLMTVIHKSYHWFPPSIINRCFTYGTGEYFCNEDDAEYIFSEMLDYLTETLIKRTSIILFRDLTNPLFGFKSFREQGYFPIRWMRTVSYFNQGTPPGNQFSTSRKRQIKKALQSGAKVYSSTDPKDMIDFSEMLRTIYPYKTRKHFPCLQFLRSDYNKKIAPNYSSVFIVRYKQKIIGGCVVIYSGKKAYMPFCGGMNKLHKHKYPGVLAMYAAIKEVHKRGYDSLEYMDAGLPFKHNGFRDFVSRFGSQNESSRRWFKVHNKLLNKILSMLYV